MDLQYSYLSDRQNRIDIASVTSRKLKLTLQFVDVASVYRYIKSSLSISD